VRVGEQKGGVAVRIFQVPAADEEAGKSGGSAPVCLNAANEEAVFAFLRGEIKLFKISSGIIGNEQIYDNVHETFCINFEFNLSKNSSTGLSPLLFR